MTENGNPIRAIATWTIKPGQTEAFLRVAKTLTDEMRKNEPGCTALVWHLAPDGQTFHIYEEYTDSDALLAHIASPQVQQALPKLVQLADGPGVAIYGDTSPKLTEALAGFGAKFARPQFGFTR